jgi:acyl-CoA synthetase (NDP forming)/RimJ/RimL family protein N-acetyltransferase
MSEQTDQEAAVHVLLADGTVAALRDPTPADEDAVRRMHDELSPDSAHLRFFGASRSAGAWVARRVCRPPGPEHGAVLAVLGDRVVGVASYERDGNSAEAEVAFAVSDDLHGHGVGTLLLEHLAAHARRAGVRRFTAETLPDNTAMQRVFTDAGFTIHRSIDSGVIHVAFPLAVDDEHYLDAVAARERHADIASLMAVFRPSSIAVVGAGRHGGVGHAVLKHLLASGYPGAVYAVNPNAADIAGVPCYPSPAALPAAPDLAVLAVPPAAVVAAADECGTRGGRALLVLTSGLDAPIGTALLATCREHGMRLVGPNCIGVASTAPALPFDATFARDALLPGSVGVVSQSGGIGVVLRERLRLAGVGVSLFASVGDKYDVSANDLLMWWEEDPATQVAVAYMESYGNPRKFARTARRLGRTTPVLTVVSGTSEAGQQAAATHTSAAATPLVSRQALFEQAGVVALPTIGELVGATALLAHQPPPSGPRVGVLSNAGGLGVLAADACAALGLQVPPLTPATQQALAGLLPPAASPVNPVDAGAGVDVPTLTQCLELIAGSGEVDAIVASIVPTALGELRAAIAAARTGAVTVVAADVAQPAAVEALTGEHGTVPCFVYPEDAVRALAAARQYAAWRARPAGRLPDLPGADADAARRIVDSFLRAHPRGGWLPADEAGALLASYGIPVTPTRGAATAEEAAAAADAVGYPVAVKAVGPTLVHKTEHDGVRLGLADPAEVRAAVSDLQRRLGERLTGVVVQPMARPGVEVIMGVTHDAVFGPLVLFGLGGVATDVLGDRAARLTPLTDIDAAELVRAVHAAPLLLGHRGASPVAVPALEDTLLRLGRLADQLPEVQELDLNPVIARPGGIEAVDVRVRVAPAAVADPHLRRLR